jgi:chromosome segregation ATPase
MSDQLQNMIRHFQATQSHLQATQSRLQATQNEVENTRRQILAVEQELELEREESELVNQQSMELQERHCELLERYKSAEELKEDLRRYVNESNMFTDEVARRGESLVNDLRAKLAGGEVAELSNGLSISEMILESAKNALLVQAISSQHSEDPLTPLGYVTDQNMGLQQRNRELSLQVETLSRQVEDGKNEVANLNKAFELTAEDGRRKKPRRGKRLGGKQ